jgi:hypothetical protein
VQRSCRQQVFSWNFQSKNKQEIENRRVTYAGRGLNSIRVTPLGTNLMRSEIVCRAQEPSTRVRICVYESPYDSVHDLHSNRIEIQFFIGHLLQYYTHFKKKQIKSQLKCWTLLAAKRTRNRTPIRT